MITYRCLSPLALAAVCLTSVVGCRSANHPVVAEPSPSVSAAEMGPAVPLQQPRSDAVRSDLLMVGDDTLTAAEALYLARQKLEPIKTLPESQFRDQAARVLREVVQQEVGTMLLYQRAVRRLEESQHETIDTYVGREVDANVARDFGGSKTRFLKHLQQYDMTEEAFRAMVKRSALAQSYAREHFLPQIHVRRDEMLSYYEKQKERFTTAETRELFMIEIPFASQLPAGRSWRSADAEARDAAKQQARERIQEAHAALATRSFADVAKEFSKGAMAAYGGAWGEIGQPLTGDYATPTQQLFKLAQGAYSAPIETDAGCYIVKCGQVKGGRSANFEEAQEELRRELTDKRIGELSRQLMMEMLEEASVSSVDAFLAAAVERAASPDWPHPAR